MGSMLVTSEILAAKFGTIFPHLDERQRRLLMGAEARALGHGGIRLVARAAGVREATVSLGVDELDSGAGPLGRARRPGGGRKRAAVLDPGLRPALLALVEPEERGDPMSPLRWTTKSTRTLAGELTRQGHRVGADTVSDLLREEGFSLQGNAKTIEGQRHPDRDAQFRYINEQVKAHQDSADPVISVDTKKKENVGEFKNGGREWRPKGQPAAARTHDFPDEQLGKAIPYGVYDLAANAGWVNVGTDHDTAAFAVESIRRWWNAAGRAAYPGARRLLITADAGGSNGYRTRAWKAELAALRAAGRARGHGMPLPAGDIEMEPDRAPAVLPHHHELARPAADQPRGHRQHDRRHHHPHRPDRPRRARPRQLRRPGSRSATSRWPAFRWTATTGTATGTTPSARKPRARPAAPRPPPPGPPAATAPAGRTPH